MADYLVKGVNKKALHQFLNALLEDIKVLEKMIEKGLIESGVKRIGAEQELSLIDQFYRPAARAPQILAKLDNPRFNPELATFNVEINMPPLFFTGTCLSEYEKMLDEDLNEIRKVSREFGSDLVITGILPSIRKSDLSEKNLSPVGRYQLLNQSLTTLRGEPYQFRIEGTDQLVTKHDSNMIESCNNSFQVHLQLPANEFVSYYNWAQAISGPVLAAATNSPLLFGKRLWQETRIALFEQSVDTRKLTYESSQGLPRVYFGNEWLNDSVTELFHDDVARHRVILQSDLIDSSREKLERGEVPDLNALVIHNSTIYRWNRACYGITDGQPHLRIENRYLPAGPTIVDEIANAAFWLGLMSEIPNRYKNVKEIMDFDQVRTNFINAARLGLDARFNWMGEEKIAAPELILKKLLPIASKGLKKAGIEKDDIDRYLGIIKNRVKNGKTGSQWLLDSYNHMKKNVNSDEVTLAVTASMVKNQKMAIPVHAWPMADISEAGGWTTRYREIGQFMSKDVFAVKMNDIIDLAANIMDWKNIRHIPVEDEKGNLVGLVTSGMFLRFLARSYGEKQKMIPINEIMIKDPITATPETPTAKAIEIMLKNKVGCLPVVHKKKLVGIVTENDFVKISQKLFDPLNNTI